MFNINPVSIAMASAYYKAENYYQDCGNRFAGRLCSQFGIDVGSYDAGTFREIVNWNYRGESPPRSQSNFTEGSKKAPRAAVDFTFSAPKSVGIAALVLNKESIRQMHQLAVNEAMRMAESKLSYRMSSKKIVEIYRLRGEPFPEHIQAQFNQRTVNQIKKGFSIRLPATEGLLWTEVDHNLSRLDLKRGLGGDPDLHTHCVLAMHTRCPLTGDLVTIDLKWAYDNQKTLDANYKSSLARQLRQAGYALTPTEHGFEIAGITKAERDAFSDGSRIRIEKFAQSDYYDEEAWIEVFGRAFDLTDPKHRSAANRATRGGKKIEISHDQAQQLWEAKARQNDIDFNEMEARIEKAAGQAKLATLNTRLSHAIELAAAHLTERQSAIRNMSNFVMTIHSFSEFRFTPEQVEAGIQQSIDDGFLIRRNDGKTLTTRDRVENESHIEKMYARGLRAVPAICTVEDAEHALEVYESKAGFKMTASQRGAYISTLTSTDQCVVWIGDAGTGKSTAMKAVRIAAEGHEMHVIGMASSDSAVKALTKSIPNTITTQNGVVNDRHWDINVYDKVKTGQSVILVLDESSLIDADAMANLMRRVAKAREFAGNTGATCRMIIVGDNKQFSSVQAGSVAHMLAEMSNAAGSQIRLDEMIRAKGDKATQDLHYSARDTPEQALIDMLTTTGRSVVLRAKEDRYEYLANEYLKLTDKQQEESLVITGKNVDRIEINDAIRQKLKSSGRLFGDDLVVSTFESNGRTKAEAKYAGTYIEGDVVRFEFSVKGIAEKGDRLTVVRRVQNERGEHTVVLRDSNGKEHDFIPRKFGDRLSIGRLEKLTIAENEMIRFTATTKARTADGESVELKNGAGARVLSVDHVNRTITFRRFGVDELLTISADEQGLPLRHQMCKTGHSSQGLTGEEKVWLLIDSEDGTVNRQSWYTNITRSVSHCEIVSDAVGVNQIETLLRSVGKELPADKALEDRPPNAARTMNLIWNKDLTKYAQLNRLKGANLAEKLNRARELLGKSVQMTGSEKFKATIVQIAIAKNLDIKFHDTVSRKIYNGILERQREVEPTEIATQQTVEADMEESSSIEPPNEIGSRRLARAP